MINLAYLIFFVPTEGPVRMINLAYLIFFWADRRPSVNDQPCLPYFFLDRQKAQCEQSTLYFFVASTKGQ